MIKIKNFVNGEYVEPQSGRYMDNYNPSTGEVYSQQPDSDEVDVAFAIQAAQKSFASWSSLPGAERSQILMRVADIIEERADELAEAESRDQGKPLWLAKKADLPRAVLNFRFFASKILHHQEMSTDMDGAAINYSLRQPLGVAGLISPWNLPLYLLTWKIAPALAVGNTVVCKPSEVTPMTAYLLGDILNEAGVPPGVCNIIFGHGHTAGATLVKHPGVPLISFTGGTATGEKILEMSAPLFKKTGIELGGKNANIIFKDADLKKALAMSLKSSFLNSGQICLCGSRMFVQEDIYEEFLREFVKETEALKVGDPLDADTFMGPLVSQEHRHKVLSCIEQARSEDGKILTGGVIPEMPEAFQSGYFLRPTVIADLTDCSDLHQREIFGPVVTVRPFKYAHEAVKWANTSPYGLAASVWTKDLKRAHKVAAQIQAGTVWVNTWMKRDIRVPFGGMKASGLGREGGDLSFDFYTEQKNICIGTE